MKNNHTGISTIPYDFLCLYDGLKITCKDPEYFNWFLQDEQQDFFNCTANVKHKTKVKNSFVGGYKNFTIETRYTPQGWVVDIHGSVHKWINNGEHNHNDIYFQDFAQFYTELIEVFRFDPLTTEVTNLEVGVNCKVPAYVKLTIAEILENLVSMYGKYDVVCRNKKSKRDSLSVERDRRYLKMYDKGLQYKLTEPTVRNELGLNRARHIVNFFKISTYPDLINPEKAFNCRYALLTAFETIYIHNPGLLNIPSEELVSNPNIRSYPYSSFWDKLKKANRRKYKAEKERQKELVDQYCDYDINADILRMLNEKLQ